MLLVDHGLRTQLHAVRAAAQVAAVHEHEEHHSEAVRRPLQGHLPAGVRGTLQGRLRGGQHLVRAPPHRRHGRPVSQELGRLRVGLQELRRRRPVRCSRTR